MKLTVKHNYLVIPTAPQAPVCRVRFQVKQECVLTLDLQVEPAGPTFFAFLDLRQWMGAEMELQGLPEIPLRQTDEIDLPGLYQEPYRPRIHYTAKCGWSNDPNGLIWSEGAYHMYYQYNPASTTWGNMHWGHAVSPDLLHWEELGIAMHPDRLGVVYSGSGICDQNNRTGLGTVQDPPLLFYYTAYGDLQDPSTAVQCMAWSTDYGRTLQRWPGNPILGNLAGGNRDPKAVWCPELDCYLMIFYLEQDEFQLCRSDDLIHWSLHQRITMEGEEECPELLPMTASDGRRLWVMTAVHNHYLVGEFREGHFTPIQPVRQFCYGRIWATQTFSGQPDGRLIRIAWNTLHLDNPRFSQQMSFPTEAALCAEKEGYVLRQQPIAELERLVIETRTETGCVGGSAGTWTTPLSDDPYDIHVCLPMGRGNVALELFGVELYCDEAAGTVTIGGVCCPLRPTGSELCLRLLVDTCSLELFQDYGAVLCTVRRDPVVSQHSLTFRATALHEDVCVTCRRLQSIWKTAEHGTPQK